MAFAHRVQHELERSLRRNIVLNKTCLGLLAGALLAVGCGGENTSDGSDTGGQSAGGAPSGGAAGADAAAGGGSAGAAGKPGTSDVGDSCTSAAQCPAGGSGTTVCKTEWPGGYCAVSGCETHSHDCPSDPGLGGTATTGGKCVLAPAATCLALCAGNADCREGYECVAKPDAAGHGSADVCVPLAASSGGGGM